MDFHTGLISRMLPDELIQRLLIHFKGFHGFINLMVSLFKMPALPAEALRRQDADLLLFEEPFIRMPDAVSSS